MKTGRTLIVEEYECRSCGKLIYPKIINGVIQSLTKNCPKCNSPYWNRERVDWMIPWKKNSPWKRTRDAVLKRDDYHCQICTADRGLEAHHKIPKKFGGKDVVENLVTLCDTCHRGAELGKFTLGVRTRMREIGKTRDYFFKRLEALGILNQNNLHQRRPYWTNGK